ncbi:hypothetical protein Q7P37_009674 [Cladosporium fusiforme]
MRSSGVMYAFFALGNILLLLALFVFTPGFLSSTLFPTDVPALEHTKQPETSPPFQRVVFLLVDALRSDFVYGPESGFKFTQWLIDSGAAIPFTGHAAPPTVTLPRIKAITTGPIPGFADVMGNIDQSDRASFADEDSWLSRLREQNGKLIFYGDDTWLRLFASESSNSSLFMRSEGVHGLLTSEFTEVDQNVTRHVSEEMYRADWNAMILHYLGIDHIGHMGGPKAPHMIKKQMQMDDVVKEIFEAIEAGVQHRDTLLVLLGDHGMNEAGNHGGNDPGEMESTLLFASPKFRTMAIREQFECPTLPQEGTEFHYYNHVEQQDLVPTLSGLMGLHLPRNNIGKLLGELRGAWQDDETYIHLLEQNAHQLWNVVQTIFGRPPPDTREQSWFQIPWQQHLQPRSFANDGDTMVILESFLSAAEHEIQLSRQTQEWTGARLALEDFLTQAQQAIITGNQRFDVIRMVAGIVLCTMALMLCLHSIDAFWPSWLSGIFYVLLAGIYALVLSASTSERDECYFWYSFVPIWAVVLAARSMARAPKAACISRALIKILLVHCVAACWTFLGSTIERALLDRYNVGFWLTALPVIGWSWFNIVQHTLSGLPSRAIAASVTFPLATAASIFKTSCERDLPDDTILPVTLDRVSAFRAFMVLMCLTTIILFILVARKIRRETACTPAGDSTLSEKLHHLLTLFLMVQSRSVNLPLFVGMEYQRNALQALLDPETVAPSDKTPSGHTASRETSAVNVAVSIFAFAHTYFFVFGGSNSISSVDLTNAFNGVSEYDIITVAILLFSANWTGPIWWCSAACNLVPRAKARSDQAATLAREKACSDSQRRNGRNIKHDEEMEDEHKMSWMLYLSTMSALMTGSVLIVMVLCLTQRQKSMVWTLWGPKHLYDVFWVAEWHVVDPREKGILLVSKTIIPDDVLKRAALRLADSWPMVSYRRKRRHANRNDMKSIDNGFFTTQSYDTCILKLLSGHKANDDVEIYDASVLHKLFSKKSQKLIDRMQPRIFSIHVAQMKDATVFKFTMQHMAGDAVAFSEGLYGEVAVRSSRAMVNYKMVSDGEKEKKQDTEITDEATGAPRKRSRGNLCSTILTGTRKWMNCWSASTRWQTIHISEAILNGWRAAATGDDVKVSTFDLFASWVHMHLTDFNATLNPKSIARFSFVMNVKHAFCNAQDPIAECWNPLVIVPVPDYPQNIAEGHSRLVQGALDIRNLIKRTRESHDPVGHVASGIEEKPHGMDGRTLLLTSWTHAPFSKQRIGRDVDNLCEPVVVQPMLNCLKSLPVPRGQEREIGICWKGAGGGYWFTANLEEDLWRRILSV